MTDRQALIGPDDEPLTAGALIDAAIAPLNLPKRESLPLESWAASLTSDDGRRFARQAVDAARVADFATTVHFARQAETAERWPKGSLS